MAFGIGVNTKEADAGQIRGKQMPIACECWFTSQGRTIPILLKFEDENGEIQTIRSILINYTQEKRFAGIPSVEYGCSIVFGEVKKEVKLIFFKESCRWVMVFL